MEVQSHLWHGLQTLKLCNSMVHWMNFLQVTNLDGHKSEYDSYIICTLDTVSNLSSAELITAAAPGTP